MTYCEKLVKLRDLSRYWNSFKDTIDRFNNYLDNLAIPLYTISVNFIYINSNQTLMFLTTGIFIVKTNENLLVGGDNLKINPAESIMNFI